METNFQKLLRAGKISRMFRNIKVLFLVFASISLQLLSFSYFSHQIWATKGSHLTTLEAETLQFDICEELRTLAELQISSWKYARFNKSLVREFFDKNRDLYVVEVKNSTAQVPSYVNQNHDFKGNIPKFLETLNVMLQEENSIQDTILFLNLLDEPRIPDKFRCSSSGFLKEIESFHGLPLSFLQSSEENIGFPILSSTKSLLVSEIY